MTRVDENGAPIELDDAARGRLAAALDREPVIAAMLIGSQARGTQGPLSDVDLAVWLDPALTVDERLRVRLELIAAAVDVLRSEAVDVAVLNDAPPLMKHRAIGDGLRLVERDAQSRLRLEVDALIEYLDTQPLRDELERGVRNRLAEGRFGRS
ncbi:MAG TPA: nucleotidyltransferase domain-containing protein [Thermoleophilaceae bacterium]